MAHTSTVAASAKATGPKWPLGTRSVCWWCERCVLSVTGPSTQVTLICRGKTREQVSYVLYLHDDDHNPAEQVAPEGTVTLVFTDIQSSTQCVCAVLCFGLAASYSVESVGLT